MAYGIIYVLLVFDRGRNSNWISYSFIFDSGWHDKTIKNAVVGIMTPVINAVDRISSNIQLFMFVRIGATWHT